MATVIRGGTVVTAAGQWEADVRIEGERIVAVGEKLAQPGDAVVDAAGCCVMPGGIDPHTHLEMPSGDIVTADDWPAGTAAAAAGGTTCILDMITPDYGGTLAAALAAWQGRAQGRSCIDYGFHMGVIEARPDVLEEMAAMPAAGVPSFKIYLAYKGRLMVDDGAAFRIMQAAGRLGALTLVHAENGDVIDALIADALAAGRREAGVHGSVRPPATEGEATARAIALAAMARAPVYIVHVSCREALAPVARAKAAGQRVWAEVCTHHLVLTDREYRRPGFAAAPYVLSPPLRSETDRAALWDAFDAGHMDVVASDHCPWNLHGHKDRGKDDFSLIPNGAPGIEERMALAWTYGVASGRWTPEQFVARTSTAAARLFGLWPRKGGIHPGADADIVVWDPSVRRTLSVKTQQSRVDHCLYEGIQVEGQPRYVLVRGRIVAQEGHPAPDAVGWGKQAPRGVARPS